MKFNVTASQNIQRFDSSENNQRNCVKISNTYDECNITDFKTVQQRLSEIFITLGQER